MDGIDKLRGRKLRCIFDLNDLTKGKFYIIEDVLSPYNISVPEDIILTYITVSNDSNIIKPYNIDYFDYMSELRNIKLDNILYE